LSPPFLYLPPTGEPLDVPPELLLLYSQDGESKRRATTSLMRVIETALAAVTVSAPDFDTLQFFWTLRRLIKTGSGLMSISQQVEFARRFAAAHEKLVAEEAARAAERAEGNIEGEDEEAGVPRASSQTEEVARLKEMSAEYNATLKSFGIRDYQVRT
jgi:glycerol-3-phosphate O-acyltransferase/dihydroxyacetone phosphate acyltransferase